MFSQRQVRSDAVHFDCAMSERRIGAGEDSGKPMTLPAWASPGPGRAEEKGVVMDQQVVRVEVNASAYGQIVRAAIPIEAGETVFYLSGHIVSLPTKYTIQLDADRHVLCQDSDWRLMNHACEPNVRIDVERREMVAVRDIPPGEELNFNYNTTEWSMTSPFTCGCGSPRCAGEIRGFRFLSEEQRQEIAPLISPFIARKWREEKMSGSRALASFDIRALKPSVHVLAPYEIRDGHLVSPEYDPPEFRAELEDWFAPLGIGYVWHPVTLENVEQVVGALKAHQTHGPIVALNLCDGWESDGYPGLSIINALSAARIAFTGASAEFYEATTSKLKTKSLLCASGVATATFAPVGACGRADYRGIYPVIVKPDVSAGSYGIQQASVCANADEVAARVRDLREAASFAQTPLFVEQFIQGREFTTLLVEDPDAPLGLWVLPPCERVFDPRVSPAERFLIYERYWSLPEARRPIPESDPYYWYEAAPDDLAPAIARTARQAMRATGGVGYARVDMRLDEVSGQLFVLEVNAQCGLSVGDSTTVGSMLRIAGVSMSNVMERVLQHGLQRV